MHNNVIAFKYATLCYFLFLISAVHKMVQSVPWAAYIYTVYTEADVRDMRITGKRISIQQYLSSPVKCLTVDTELVSSVPILDSPRVKANTEYYTAFTVVN